MTSVTAIPAHNDSGSLRAALPHVAPFLGILAVAIILPFVSNDYWVLIGTRAAIYWVLISGLNLVVGFAGHLAIGYVALLTLGAYTTSVLAAGNVLPPVPIYGALVIASCVGAVFGVIVGLPAMRLRTFSFAMTTLGFATIVTQIALAWQSVTGGCIGIVGPEFSAPFNTPSAVEAYAFSRSLCVVASTKHPFARNSSNNATASAAPSSGAVPVPISSTSTSDSAVADAKIDFKFNMCAENVDKSAAIDCSSPISTST